jgi:hypothetical protein
MAKIYSGEAIAASLKLRGKRASGAPDPHEKLISRSGKDGVALRSGEVQGNRMTTPRAKQVQRASSFVSLSFAALLNQASIASQNNVQYALRYLRSPSVKLAHY